MLKKYSPIVFYWGGQYWDDIWNLGPRENLMPLMNWNAFQGLQRKIQIDEVLLTGKSAILIF